MDKKIVTRDRWLSARRALLAREKEHTAARVAISRDRRSLPWVRIEKEYIFDTVRGPESLRSLFGPRSQLVIYHFMFGPDDDAGCPHCSFWADSYDGVTTHLAQRDVTFVLASRAPLPALQAYRHRMG